MSNVAVIKRNKPFGHPLFALGFRPFYLAAIVFAMVALPLWLANYLGVVRLDGYLQGIQWHNHEMVFGFAPAVIAGFLLTAVRNWTNQPTPAGISLAALVALWALARVLLLTEAVTFAVIVDLTFLPLLGFTIAVPIWRSRNVRNFKLLAVLAGLTAANALYHLANLGLMPRAWIATSTTLALDLITVLMAIIGGRVIPAFTANAISATNPISNRYVEFISVGALVMILIVGVLDTELVIGRTAWVSLLTVAALAHTVRWVLWQPHRTMGNALLWMLPTAYAWIPISLALRALVQLDLLPSVTAVHALTLGAIGGLMVAMMIRSSLGHTGRTLNARAPEVFAFLLIQVAACVRVAGTMIDSGAYRSSLILSGSLWSLAFAILLVRYGPMLWRPRVDGRSG